MRRNKDDITFAEVLEEEFPKDEGNKRPFYRHTNTSSKAKGKKTNYICKQEGCGYSARIWISPAFNPPSNMSTRCPKHGDTLINVGNAVELPKKGKREKLKQMYK